MDDRASKFKGLLWLLGGILLAVGLAFGVSPLVRAVPWSWEQNLQHSLEISPTSEVCMGNTQTEALLDRLVDRIYPLQPHDERFSIKVRVIHNEAVNAFAELGGRITLNSEMLKKAESAEEIAGVLAHEIEHVRRRHVLEGFVVHLMTWGGIQMIFGSNSNKEWSNYLLKMSFGRAKETEADKGALERLQKAHIDNHGFRNFFERMKELPTVPAFLTDHPSNEARSQMADKFPNQDTKPIMTTDEWKSFKDYCR